MKKKYKMQKLEDLTPLKDSIERYKKIQLKAQRMRWYEKTMKLYRQNNTFKTDKENSWETGKVISECWEASL